MKISYSWLQRYISPIPTAEETSRLLTASGLEVEGLELFESHKGGLKGLVVGEVKTCVQHPNADRLRLTTVDVGGTELLSIVCGAPNVAAGQKVVVATIGTELFPSEGEAFTIKESKIRGELSQGMLCAEDEIGLGGSHAGIIVLPASTKIGTNPNKAITSAVATYVNDAVITSSPGFNPNPIIAICNASVPFAQGITCFAPK